MSEEEKYDLCGRPGVPWVKSYILGQLKESTFQLIKELESDKEVQPAQIYAFVRLHNEVINNFEVAMRRRDVLLGLDKFDHKDMIVRVKHLDAITPEPPDFQNIWLQVGMAFPETNVSQYDLQSA